MSVRAEQDICFERVINFVDFSQYLNFEGILTLCSQRLNRCPLKLENAEAEPSKYVTRQKCKNFHRVKPKNL